MSTDGRGPVAFSGSRRRPLRTRTAGGRTGPGFLRGEPTGGFTLLEVLVALTVVGMLVVGVLGALAAGLRAEAAATEAREVASLSSDLLTSLTLLPADELLALDGRETRLDPPFEDYRWSARTRRSPAVPGLVEVRLAVDGPGRSVELLTVLHRPDNGERP